MKHLAGRIYLEYHELVCDGVCTSANYKNMKIRGQIEVLGRGGRGCSPLIAFDSLPDRIKKLIELQQGVAEAAATGEGIRTLTEQVRALHKRHINEGDFAFFKQVLSHKKATDIPTKVLSLQKAAGWLRLLAEENATALTWLTCGNVPAKTALRNAVLDCILDEEPLYGLAVSSVRVLQRKELEFIKLSKTEGIHAALANLIPGQAGNRNRAKITTEQQVALLRELYRQPNGYNSAQIAAQYNAIAVVEGWATIDERTVVRHLHNPAAHLLTISARKGKSELRKLIPVIEREAPSAPLYLAVHDGTPYELYYQDNGKSWNRMEVVAVIDAYNWLVLGWAAGPKEDTDLIRQALLNAAYNIKQATGEWYMPWQMQADHAFEKSMRPMYEVWAHDVTLAEVGNARAKVIEPFFAQLRTHITRRHPNHAGGNITSNDYANRDWLSKHKQLFPDKQQTLLDIATDMDDWNNMPCQRNKGMSRKESWMKTFAALADKDKRVVMHEKVLLGLGKRHNYGNRLDPAGVKATLAGQSITYNSLDSEWYMNNLGCEYLLHYNPNNLDEVLAVKADGSDMRMLHELTKPKMALRDMKAGDGVRLQQRIGFQKQIQEQVLETMVSDLTKLEAIAYAKTGFIEKGQQKTNWNAAKSITKAEMNGLYDPAEESLEIIITTDTPTNTSRYYGNE